MIFKRRNLTLRQYQVLIKAATALLVFRILLFVIKFTHIRKMIKNAKPTQNQKLSPYEIVWSVSAIGRRTPLMTCLVQACAAQFLLKQSGHFSQMCFGVKKEGKLKSHAWIEQNGFIILGKVENIKDYKPIFIEN